MIEQMHTLATILSLALTPVAVLLSVIVVALWWTSAKHAIFNDNKKDVHWFIIGVTVSFLGSILDNAYWGVTWLAEYLNSQYLEALFHYGVFSNVPFRQACTVIAAACHIRAAMLTGNKKLKLSIALVWVTVPASIALLLLAAG